MRLRIRVYAESAAWSGSYDVEVPDPIRKRFAPIDRVDAGLEWIGGNAMGESRFRVETELREDAAKYLAAALADGILHEMCKNDTRNGYPITPNISPSHASPSKSE